MTSNTTNGPVTNGTPASSSSGATTTTGGASNSGTSTNAGVGGTNSATTDANTSMGGTSAGGTSSTTEGTSSSTGSDTTAGGTGGTGGGGNNPIVGTDNYDCSPPEGEVPPLKLTQVGGNLARPVDVTHPPNDNRLFVIQLDGTVRIIKDGQLVETPFLSLGNKVVAGGAGGDERGLLGIAFHPNYAQNGLFYLHYSAGSGVPGANTSDTVIEEYKVSSDPDVADPASARVVLTVEQPDNGNALFLNHKGGSINFGPDGMLYIGLGDGGGSGDDHGPSGSGFAQNTSMLLGKMLRIDPVESGGQPYTTPPDNLVQSMQGAAPEIWSYGLRNPFRSSFDACTGDLYIGDVGQNEWEELNIQKAGEGHKNYGWNTMEALHCYGSQSCDQNGLTPPFIELDRDAGRSITGGSVYRGSSIPALRGAYFYADYSMNNAWYLRYDRDAGTVSTPVAVAQELNVTSVVAIKNGPDGELYFVSLGPAMGNNPGGGVFRLEAAQ